MTLRLLACGSVVQNDVALTATSFPSLGHTPPVSLLFLTGMWLDLMEHLPSTAMAIR